MRACFSLMIVSLVAGCASNTSSGPGKLPPEAQGAMYTVRPAAEVAQCIARSIGGTMHEDAGRQIVTSPLPDPSSYSAGINAAGGIYPTQIVVYGDHAVDAERQKAALCL